MSEAPFNSQRARPISSRPPAPHGLMLSAGSLTGDEVSNRSGEKLGHIKDFMIDIQSGHIHYAVMSCGGFLGMGDRLFAVPWNALQLDRENNAFFLDVDVERLKKAPGFDKDDWPNMADEQWASGVATYYKPQTNRDTSRL